MRDGVEERQRYFAFAQVVAGRFAYGFVFVVVEDVILYLEAQTQEFTESFEAARCCCIGVDRQSSHVHARFEE